MIKAIVGVVRNRIERKKPTVSRAEVLAARPVRNPQVEWAREKGRDEEGTTLIALLKIPRRKDRFGNVVAKLFRLPEFRKLELDETGSDVWEMCDGTNNVEAITKAICTKYRLNRRQAETSVTAYMKMLAERRLILLRKDRPAGAGTKTSKSKKATQTISRRQKRA